MEGIPPELVKIAVGALITLGVLAGPFAVGFVVRSQSRAILPEDGPLPWHDILATLAFWLTLLLGVLAVASGFGYGGLASSLVVLVTALVRLLVGALIAAFGMHLGDRIARDEDDPAIRRWVQVGAVLLGLAAVAGPGLLIVVLLAVVPLAVLLSSRTLQAQAGSRLGDLAAGLQLRSRHAGNSQLSMSGHWLTLGGIGLLSTSVTEGDQARTLRNVDVLALVEQAEAAGE